MKTTATFRTFAVFAALFILAPFAHAQTAHGWDANGRPILVTLPSLPEAGVTSLTVNGQALKGDVHIEAQNATFDPATNTLLFSETSGFSKSTGQGNATISSTEGNTTISGTLTVTGNTYLGTSSNPVYAYGGVIAGGSIIHSYDAGTGSASVTITKDVTEILDAGGPVTLTLPIAQNGRRLTLYNESATYSASDGGSITVSPNSKLDLVAVGGQWR